MKRGIALFILLMMVISINVNGAFYYPESSSQAVVVPEKTERINIVFDNSGHDHVKEGLGNVFLTSVIAEHSEVWLYPIAGSNPSIKIEPNRQCVEENFAKYSKASNELKSEDVIQTAINDLLASSYSSKRLFFMVDFGTSDKSVVYDYLKFTRTYPALYPDITFTVCYVAGSVLDGDYVDIPSGSLTGDGSNYDGIDGKYIEFILLRNGYAKCEATYDDELGYAKIDKGKADKNLFVLADDEGKYKWVGDEKVKGLYISGCAMGESKYSDYLSKNKIKGVALSYNQVIFETKRDDGSAYAAALFTLDGDAVNPDEEAIIIPVLNAADVEIYHRETPQSGICSKDTSYNSSYDKKITNLYKDEDSYSSNDRILKDESIFPESESVSEKNGGFNIGGILLGILKGILSVILWIIRFIFSLIPLALLIFFILFFTNPKFQANVKLKIHESKWANVYDSIEAYIIKIKENYFGGDRVKTTRSLDGKYDVFICKKTEDMQNGNSRASKIVRELTKRGIKCWLSEDAIDIGKDHEDVIPGAIRDTKMFIIFLSTRSIHSKQVISEFKTAKDMNKEILPVQIDDFDLFGKYENWKFRLQPYQKVDAFSSKDEDIKKIADKIEKRFRAL